MTNIRFKQNHLISLHGITNQHVFGVSFNTFTLICIHICCCVSIIAGE